MSAVTRAGPASASSYAFAIMLPLCLLAITVFTSLRVGDKLERDYLEELAINEAIKEAEEEGEGEGGDDVVEIEEREEERGEEEE